MLLRKREGRRLRGEQSQYVAGNPLRGPAGSGGPQGRRIVVIQAPAPLNRPGGEHSRAARGLVQGHIAIDHLPVPRIGGMRQDGYASRSVGKPLVDFLPQQAGKAMVGRQLHPIKQQMLGLRDENISINWNGPIHDAQQGMFGALHRGFAPLDGDQVIV